MAPYSGGGSSSDLAQPQFQRIALLIQYLGTDFWGWQRQRQGRTVQSVLEETIQSITGETVTVHCAGRTDSGVHAAGQVAHFDSVGPIPAQRWMKVLNGRLPNDLLVRASAPVPPDWHARFSATYRRYRYSFYTDPCPNLFLATQTWHYYQAPLDETAMLAALEPLVGQHDLSAFERAGSDRPHAWVELQAVQCQRRGPMLEVELQAKGFLYGMVRLLVGMLVRVGEGTLSLEAFEAIWRQQRRDLVKHSAPAKGLCLLRVGYPESPFPPGSWYNTQPLFVLPAGSHFGNSHSGNSRSGNS
ncbi:MAG: tRNA pseudouridine(38-40) synthase TruA [Synechococcales cyanobacterium RM1_1_8]|nr:tRNA pseudouridine(38-40) synthase TruA [Synechococcales cyanobacterium RM1_1_8]